MADTKPDLSRPYFPRSGVATDGWTSDTEATATCLCGAVQLVFPTEGPGLLNRFVCHCADCRKLTASMFASNFAVADTHLKHVRGRDHLKSWGQSDTPKSGTVMTNYFCDTCGTLMYRAGEVLPGHSVLRIGTVDDFHLHETKLKPQMEVFVENRVGWLKPLDGVKQIVEQGQAIEELPMQDAASKQ